MKIGDLVQVVAGQPDDRRNNGICLLIDISSPSSYRVATVMTPSGEFERWALDSHYESRVINENR